MSILKSIQVAENKAEQIRLQATEEVNQLLEMTKIKSEEKAKKLYDERSSEEQRINESITTKINDKAREIDEVYKEDDKSLEVLANKKMDQVVDFIFGKVFDL